MGCERKLKGTAAGMNAGGLTGIDDCRKEHNVKDCQDCVEWDSKWNKLNPKQSW